MNRETVVPVQAGWLYLVLDILCVLILIALFIVGTSGLDGKGVGPEMGTRCMWMLVPFVFLVIFLSAGFFMLQPNEAAVLLLFGKYVGTVKQEGFCWTNPFYRKMKISLRLRNLNGERLKVNDHAGNPIEIAAVIVWRVRDTFAAFFEVNDYIGYVQTQSESALRHLSSAYPYDNWEDERSISLRANIDEVSVALEQELQTRLDKAGVEVLEARLSHLAYASEIAEAMLRRQQASAIIAARQKIVEGAVGMVHMALEMLKQEKVVDLDEERKAAMVSNLLVILCSENHAQPVVNAGTLYH
ncbi:MAG TPA: SPFH domain-containing protein [Candidatus Sumerlaeota bacterium]|nr:SPFH domain-containing protein [Candidatus Sumerlaeota bacterium]HPS01149.1 SPFH domain-containing protein [Candidatus Sumerlaeota bacterium]